MKQKNKKLIEKQPSFIRIKAIRLFFLLCLTSAVGYISSVVINPQTLGWYDTLIKSDLTPPASWFGIVWTLLYFLMAISAFLTWGKASPRPFVLQLSFNLIWPFVFFYLKETVLGLAVILIMIYFVWRTMEEFWKASHPAALLLLPLFVWSCFAAYLNLIVVLYNTKAGVWFGLI